MKRLVIPALILLTPASVVGADIPRNGELRIPSTEELARVCRENPNVNTDKRLAYCVLSELDGAEGVMAMIADHRAAASEAYWDCVDTPEINSFALLNACMEQELGIDPEATVLETDQNINELQKES